MTSIYDYPETRDYIKVHVQGVAPPIKDKDLWLDTNTATWYVAQGGAWVQTGGGVGSLPPAISVGPVAPGTPAVGDAWLDNSVAGSPTLKVYTAANTWTVPRGAVQLPVGTRHGQTLVAGAGPAFTFSPGDLDAGRY